MLSLYSNLNDVKCLSLGTSSTARCKTEQSNLIIRKSYEPLHYTTARVFVLRIRVLCAFPTHCTCVEFKLRMKRESTYFETHEYSLAAPNAFQR